MKRTKKEWNADLYMQYEDEGRGRGERLSYKPYIGIDDLTSKGWECRQWSVAVPGKLAELFSKHEKRVFNLVDLRWKGDIREQYALPRELTLRIAREMGVKHPRNERTKEPFVLTTDLVLVPPYAAGSNPAAPSRWIALDIKEERALKDVRQLEKLEIRRRAWAELGHTWRLITPREIPEVLYKNVLWIRTAHRKWGTTEKFPGEVEYINETVRDELMNHKQRRLDEACAAIDCAYGFDAGTAMKSAKRLVRDEVLKPDLFGSLIPDQTVGSMFHHGDYRQAA